jgi:hypothetical protein
MITWAGIKRMANHVWWGSARGPAIVLDWENRTISLRRLPPRHAVLVAHWLHNGMSEGDASIGKHARPGPQDRKPSLGGGAHERPGN